MANKFTITIDAVDRATKKITNVNDAVSRMTRPMQQLGQSIKQFSNVAGLGKVGDQLGRIASTAMKVVAPLASMAGWVAGLVGISTIAGVAALATEWGHLGFNIVNTAAAIGISAIGLQQWRGAAILAGLSADAMDAALTGVGDAFENVKYFRDPAGFMMLNKLGISVKTLRDGSIDTSGALHDLSRAIHGMGNVQAQRVVAGHFGVMSILPLLQQGPDAMDAYIAKINKMNYAMNPAQAKAFGESMADLQVAWQGILNTTLPALTGALKPVIDEFTAWVQTPDAKKFFTEVADDIKLIGSSLKSTDWKGFGNDIKAVGIGLIAGEVAVLAWNLKSILIPAIGGIGTALAAAGTAAAGGGLLATLGSLGLFAGLGALVGKYTINPILNQIPGMEDADTIRNRPGVHLTPGAQAALDAQRFGAPQPGAAAASTVVEVRFANAPPGTTATATRGGDKVPVRISHAMPSQVGP